VKREEEGRIFFVFCDSRFHSSFRKRKAKVAPHSTLLFFLDEGDNRYGESFEH
jgi:hypothetical protein